MEWKRKWNRYHVRKRLKMETIKTTSTAALQIESHKRRFQNRLDAADPEKCGKAC